MLTKITNTAVKSERLSMHPLTILFLVSGLSIMAFQRSSILTPELTSKGNPVVLLSSINGRVIDSKGKILSGVKICLYNEFGDSILCQKSQLNGEYNMNQIPLGEYELRVNHTIYEEFVSPLSVKEGGAYLEILLVEKSSPGIVTSKKTGVRSYSSFSGLTSGVTMSNSAGVSGRGSRSDGTAVFIDGVRNEEYKPIKENNFIKTADKSVSTFSSDVDNASYTNVRRMINQKQVPIMDAVRVEEFINYFDYDYDEPKEGEDISIQMEEGACPWKPEHKLVKIGLKTREIEKSKMSRNNLVFLIDVSGSMESENKLPMVQSALKTMLNHLNPDDQVAIVTYAGSTKVALQSTPCSNSDKIKKELDALNAFGSTAGGEGIILAYKEAKNNFIQDGNNRIILVTDGDFNVGITGESELLKLIEEKRKEGVYLTVCGFGMGNIKDSKMEMLADNGNGSYYYIDDLKEADRVFGYGLSSTLMTMAKDVKIQVEFNPAFVQAYRLIGYENRYLENRDFVNDAKDAGEMGAGQTVTALYEIIPVGINMNDSTDLPLKYKRTTMVLNDSFNELLTVKVRYKKPKSSNSIEVSKVLAPVSVSEKEASTDFRLAGAVALFGMLLRGSEYAQDANYNLVLKLLEGIENEKVNELKGMVAWMNHND